MTTTTNNTRVKVPNKTLPSTETISKEKYDGSTPNPKGRVDPEKCVGAIAKLLKCKQEIITSTMNIRTIREEHKQIELKYNFEYHNIDILGIQEHRIIHDEKVRYKTIGRSIFVTTSASINQQPIPFSGW